MSSAHRKTGRKEKEVKRERRRGRKRRERQIWSQLPRVRAVT